MSAEFNSRLRRTIKDVTFTGAAGLGAQGTVAFGTVTGAVHIVACAGYVVTDLAGASATLALGTAGVTTGLISTTTATDLDAGEVWSDTGPSVLEAAVVDKVVSSNIIGTVATADITGRRLQMVYWWRPMTANGNLA